MMYKPLLAAIGQLQHLQRLRITPHPGGAASHDYPPPLKEHVFKPEGSLYWQGWAENDCSYRHSTLVRTQWLVNPFSHARLHATLKKLDLAYGRATPRVPIWRMLGPLVHKFTVLEVLDLSGVAGGVYSEPSVIDLEGMLLLLTTLPPSLKELHLACVTDGRAGRSWSSHGAFEALAALPSLTELNMEETGLGLDVALELLHCCLSCTNLHVVCNRFELPAGDDDARIKQANRLAAVAERTTRALKQLAW